MFDDATPVIRRRSPKSQRRRDGLIQFAHDFTSQNGEDGILRHIFEAVLPPNENGIRHCVDVGAWDGRHLSNTFSLLVGPKHESITIAHDQHNDGSWIGHHDSRSIWRGVLIEADPGKFRELQSLHEPLGNTCLNVAVSSNAVSESSLASILQKSTVQQTLPLDFDFLCIDVDGADYWLLHDVLTNTSYRPKVICIEFNPTMPNDLVYIPPCNDNLRHGASLAALVELAEMHNYLLVETTIYNAFFLPKHLYEQCFQDLVPDTSIEALHETTMVTSLYQLYDGTLKLWGCKKLLWHRLPIEEERFQMLPPSQRNFPFAPNITSTTTEISDPVVDISAYCQSQVTEPLHSRRECSSQLLEQLKSHGFALVHGTGISAQLCRDALRMTHLFLQEADESVRRSCMSIRDRARRGYSPINTENFASLIGEQGPNDLVRKFRIGSESSTESSLLQPNIWPAPSEHWDEETCDEFRSVVEAYYDAICIAANSIVQCICDGLLQEDEGLAASLDFLSSSNSQQSSNQRNGIPTTGLAHKTSILTLLGYQTGSRHTKKHHKKKRAVHPLVAAHTDVGVITVLLYDSGDCAVLQRQVSNSESDKGKFKDVVLPYPVPDDPIFVVNIADCLSALSHDTLPSTIHRVVPAEGSIPRNCLALFVGFDPDQELKLKEGKTVSYETWRKDRIAESQKVLRNRMSVSKS
ncbi:2OG-Fe(II) oxygenase superfamily protein [Nitzschia inconspicua]|uniref:2OG-Fe(II) oxygenase superfamily protein n=1 Tax=Nitzschia inconspicua TaxID=303405 RepID=A0A9K3L3N1_9STRA|nr:2OG-Fe(II) oxygenase superfamily protein [Nitzschia inconspicua]